MFEMFEMPETFVNVIPGSSSGQALMKNRIIWRRSWIKFRMTLTLTVILTKVRIILRQFWN